MTFATVVTAGCHRAPPARADEIERPSFESPEHAPARASRGGHSAVPRTGGDLSIAVGGGAQAIGDRLTCTVALYQLATEVWRRALSGCDMGLSVAIRFDRVVLARTEQLMVAYDPDGAERWRLTLDEGEPPPGLSDITVLRDSSAAVAVSPTSVMGVTADGRASWRFELPADTPILAPPRATETEGLVLATRAGALWLHNDGTFAGRYTVAPARPRGGS
ncbi:MAG: hypothetical protein WCJ30_03975 [Deltaproteobacteria bacterium]